MSIEVHHALNLVGLGQFDTIYHEHFQYYTVLSAMRALATADLAVVDVELIPTHGGSIRVWARPNGSAGPRSERVIEVLRMEEEAGLDQVDGYLQLRPLTEAVPHDLLRFLLDCRAEGKRVVGYGAPGEGSTLLNYRSGIRTTAGSGAICSSTRSIETRTNTVASRRGHASQSTIPPRSIKIGPMSYWHCPGTLSAS